MKTVVTGGAGFIGSNLVRKLLDVGREVAVVDDYSRGSLQNLLDLGIKPSDVGIDITSPAIDLREYEQALAVIQNTDTVFHMAAHIGSIDYLHGSDDNELTALQSNLAIDTNVFRACQNSNVKIIVYASSAAVYPVSLQHCPGVVLSENLVDIARNHVVSQVEIDPDGGYGWAKLMGEIQLSLMSQINVGIARIFNVYGENQDLTTAVHVIPSLFLKAGRYPGDDFVVWGDGQQSRDFVYVQDCADALIALEGKAASCPLTVNIGSGEAVNIATVAEKVITLSDKNIRIKYDSGRPIGPISRTADISRAKSLLGWQPQTSLDEGLRQTFSWINGRITNTYNYSDNYSDM